MASEERHDVVVVGAGFASLAAAKEYIQCAPYTDLVVLDDKKSIGGVWAKENIYEGLHSNNLRGTFEFPDWPLHDGYGVKIGEHIPGLVIHQYLNDYAKHFDIANKTRLQTKVVEVEKLDEGWRLFIEHDGIASTMKTSKLIIGTGQTSKSAAMHLPGEESFGAPMINAAHIATEAPPILDDPSITNITIFGGSKFAYDCVYKFASAGKEIEWVIRESGHGPTWIFTPYQYIPLMGRQWVERLVTRRFFAWMSPCYWGGLDGSGWWRYLLHETWLGRMITAGFWSKMSEETLKQSGFTNHPNLKPLWPDCSMFDMATSVAVLNYPTDVLDFVRSGQVRVHRQDITHLSHHTVHLKNGTALESDAFVASTGWIWGPTIRFRDTALHADLGIPSFSYSSSQRAHWAALDAKADHYFLNRYPMLRNLKHPRNADAEDLKEQPLSSTIPNAQKREFTPLRLYRGIAPPGLAAAGDRSLAFVGYAVNITHTIKAELSGLWIYAYFHGKLVRDPARDVADVDYETALFQRFSVHRHPYGFGRRFPDFVFDAIPFNDVLLRDVGLSGLRKGGSWRREAFESYTTADYRGVTEEWLAKNDGVMKKKS